MKLIVIASTLMLIAGAVKIRDDFGEDIMEDSELNAKHFKKLDDDGLTASERLEPAMALTDVASKNDKDTMP